MSTLPLVAKPPDLALTPRMKRRLPAGLLLMIAGQDGKTPPAATKTVPFTPVRPARLPGLRRIAGHPRQIVPRMTRDPRQVSPRQPRGPPAQPSLVAPVRRQRRVGTVRPPRLMSAARAGRRPVSLLPVIAGQNGEMSPAATKTVPLTRVRPVRLPGFRAIAGRSRQIVPRMTRDPRKVASGECCRQAPGGRSISCRDQLSSPGPSLSCSVMWWL